MEKLMEQQDVMLLQQEIAWLEAVIDTALILYFENECNYSDVRALEPPVLRHEDSGYAKLLNKYNFEFEERILLALALAPLVKPQCLDVFLIKNKNLDCEFSEFGGVKTEKQYGFVPTLETACFILGGAKDIQKRLAFIKAMRKHHILYKEGILYSDNYPVGLHEKLRLSEEYLSSIISDEPYLPAYNSKFPAKEITTKLSWDDLILEDQIKNQLNEVQSWLKHSNLILHTWQMDKTLKPGYKVLFYGAPGTGKTLAATLLGKATNKPVFRIDLSMVVSKYIGETEKNLGRLFDEATSKSWILFFDEADALFSKRTQTNSSNDRHANQEVAYLLQRIEDFDGLVILATNLQTNIDDAFLRRFQNTIDFPKPKYRERKLLWKKMIGEVFEVKEGAEALDQIARDYELSGGEMINVLRYCAVKAANEGEKRTSVNDIITGIKREYHKSNKTLN